MTKEECITIFNAQIRGMPISFEKQIIPLISDYLTEINCEKINEMIYLIGQNPQIVQNIFPQIIEHYCKKFNITKVVKPDKFNNFNIIMYYG